MVKCGAVWRGGQQGGVWGGEGGAGGGSHTHKAKASLPFRSGTCAKCFNHEFATRAPSFFMDDEFDRYGHYDDSEFGGQSGSTGGFGGLDVWRCVHVTQRQP